MGKQRILLPASFLAKLGGIVIVTVSIIIFAKIFLYEDEADKFQRTKSERDDLKEWILEVESKKKLDYSERLQLLDSLENIVQIISSRVESSDITDVSRPAKPLDRQRMITLIDNITKKLEEGKTIRKVDWIKYRQDTIVRFHRLLGAYRNWQIQT